MLLMKESEMERRTEKVSPPPPPPPPPTKSVRVKRESRDRKHKVKIHEPHKGKERNKGEEEDDNEDIKEVLSTVINVDSVRRRTNRDSEELLGLLESEWHEEALKPRSLGGCELLLTIAALAAVIFFFPISIWFCVKIIREHERAVVFRLGHLLQRKPSGPGLLFYLPLLDVCHKVDIRVKMLKVPSHLVQKIRIQYERSGAFTNAPTQEMNRVVTKDLVCTEASAVCYYRIENMSVCYSSLAGVPAVLQALVQVSVREVVAHHTFTNILQNRSGVSQQIQVALDSITCKWGIKVERAEIEDLALPPELQQNYAVEAEARRRATVKVIAAEGEKAVCEALKTSVDSLSDSPLAVQLRLLQLLHTLRSDQPAVLLSLPSDLLNQTLQPPNTGRSADPNRPAGDIAEGGVKDSPMM